MELGLSSSIICQEEPTRGSKISWRKQYLPSLESLDIDVTVPRLQQFKGKTSQAERIRANRIQYDSDMALSMRILGPIGVVHSNPNTPAHISSLLPLRPHTALAPIKQLITQSSKDIYSEIGHDKFQRRVLSAPPTRLKARSLSMSIVAPKHHESSQFTVPMHRVQRFLQSSGGSMRTCSPSDHSCNHRSANLLRESFKFADSERSDFERELAATKDYFLYNR